VATAAAGDRAARVGSFAEQVTTTAESFHIRAAEPRDRVVLLQLLSASLLWVPDALFDRFFSWKHEEGPFGRSPAWVAVDGDRIAGFRTFLRWEFEHPDGWVRRAVRAVDTATHPDYQGRGIFRALTLHALDQLRADGVDFVFNTPNAQSLPGYLKMGWAQVGRLPTAVRPTGVGPLARMLRSRVPAERWSISASAGAPAREALADERVTTLLRSLPAPRGLRTRRSPAYLRWRYGFEPLDYRVIAVNDDPAEGLSVFRVRRRGAATEATLCEVLVPPGASDSARQLQRAVVRSAGVDYAIRLGGPLLNGAGFLRFPRQGPMLTWRAIADGAALPARSQWDLALGDIELL
jgi:GNAT superfamily N-acetyltransferase